ncbi:hypothetical protein, partial [Devosia sp.]|uniref:hypothetical protein n=1 Tax=Devosia sp. TaxID=1871048 RepID=UPI002B001A36
MNTFSFFVNAENSMTKRRPRVQRQNSLLLQQSCDIFHIDCSGVWRSPLDSHFMAGKKMNTFSFSRMNAVSEAAQAP